MSCKSDCNAARHLVRNGTISVRSTVVSVVFRIAFGILFSLSILVTAVPAQTETTYEVGTSGGMNSYKTLEDLRNSDFRFGASGSQTILLYGNDTSLLNSPLRVCGYSGGLDSSVVTFKSSQSGTQRTVEATDARLFFVHPEQRNLDYWPVPLARPSLVIDKDIVVTGKRSDTNTSGVAGGVTMISGDLNVDGVTFRNNFGGNDSQPYVQHIIGTNIWYYGLWSSTSGGGALYAKSDSYYLNNFGWYTTVSGKNAVFENNDSLWYAGGAAYLDTIIGDFTEATFSRNIAGGNGGAVYVTNSYVNFEKATFNDNTSSGNGGAIFSENSDLSLKGASFVGNTSQGSGAGLYYRTTTGTRHLELGAFEGQTARFSNNIIAWNNSANSIYFDINNATVNVDVDVERFGRLEMKDPMQASLPDSQLHFTKTGEGVWSLAGNNQFSNGTFFNINEGTFLLENGVNFGNLSRLTVASGATLETGTSNTGTPTVLANIDDFSMRQGSTLQLTGDLALVMATDSTATIGATLSGQGDLSVYGNKTLNFTGKTSNFSGDVNIGNGMTFNLDSPESFVTAGDLNLGDNSILGVVAGGAEPTIKVKDFDIGNNVQISLNGIYGDSETPFVVIDSDSVINGSFINEGVAVVASVDYLHASLGKSTNQKQYLLSTGLSWNKTDGTAHGTFTIEENNPLGAPGEFKVSSSLTYKNATAGWNGMDLTKAGGGVLELAAQNSYRNSYINEGTLRLTHSGATESNSTVFFSTTNPGKEKILELDFREKGEKGDYRYDTRIGDTDGVGKVVKSGDSTILLANVSNRYGDTEIKEGALAVETQRVLGSGTVFFSGGALQYRNRAGGEQFDRRLESATQNDNILLDLQQAMHVTGVLAGEGGLVKTGRPTLTLDGTIDYKGDTVIKEGTLALASASRLADPTTKTWGAIVINDGTTLQNSANVPQLVRNIVLEAPAKNITKQGAVIDTRGDLTLWGDISGEGMLVKKGADSTLTLAGQNSSTGGTRIDEGTIAISDVANLGQGELTFNGGTLRNTQVIDNFEKSVTAALGQSARFETQEDLVVNSRIGGSGGLIKTGAASLTLNGVHDYRGLTQVQSGKLIVDGTIYSETHVADGAVLRGSGTIVDDVHFAKGSVYEWYCGHKISESSCLNVLGDVYLDGTTFRAVTAGGNPEFFSDAAFSDPVNGRKVLTYGTLKGDQRFAVIDNSYSPFYQFDLDYSENGVVKVTAQRRDEALGLSDGVAVGLTMAQHRAHRRSFDRIDDSFRESRYAMEPVNGRLFQRFLTPPPPPPRLEGQYRGQRNSGCRNAWGEIYGRTTQYESTHFKKDWRLNSFGFQAGYSFCATPDLNWGLTFGTEFPELKNSADKIEMSEFYVGAYYGRRLWRMWELKGYLGGGSQRYELHRFDPLYYYKTRYYGESFQANLELARPFRWGNTIVKPLVGFDLDYAQQQSSLESKPDALAEYRAYSRASLTRMHVRVGLDFERRFQRGDAYFGIAYSNMIGGDSVPTVGVYYPTAKMAGTIRGANLGQNIFTYRLGGNLYLRGSQSNILFWTFTADTYADRSGGQGEFSGSVGYSRRF